MSEQARRRRFGERIGPRRSRTGGTRLSEIAVITSAGPARGIWVFTQKGHLGVGADADLTLYRENPGARGGGEDGWLFRISRYVIKGGEIAVEEGDIKAVKDGRQFLVKPALDEKIEEYLRPVFQKVIYDVVRQLPRGRSSD